MDSSRILIEKATSMAVQVPYIRQHRMYIDATLIHLETSESVLVTHNTQCNVNALFISIPLHYGGKRKQKKVTFAYCFSELLLEFANQQFNPPWM